MKLKSFNCYSRWWRRERKTNEVNMHARADILNEATRPTRRFCFMKRPRGHTTYQGHQGYPGKSGTSIIKKFSNNPWQVKAEGRKGHRAWLINSKGKDYHKPPGDAIFVMTVKIRVTAKRSLSCRVLRKLIMKHGISRSKRDG